MTFAICLQVPNHIFFGRFNSIWAEFLPQLLFMESIFGYVRGFFFFESSAQFPFRVTNSILRHIVLACFNYHLQMVHRLVSTWCRKPSQVSRPIDIFSYSLFSLPSVSDSLKQV